LSITLKLNKLGKEGPTWTFYPEGVSQQRQVKVKKDAQKNTECGKLFF